MDNPCDNITSDPRICKDIFSLLVYWTKFDEYRESYRKDKEEAVMKKIQQIEARLESMGYDMARIYVHLQQQGLDIPDSEDALK